jgi:hypothetical protein
MGPSTSVMVGAQAATQRTDWLALAREVGGIFAARAADHDETDEGAFFRSVGLERLLRDVHGGQYHSLQEKRQHLFTGRVARGLDPVG